MQVRKSFLFLALANPRESAAFFITLPSHVVVCRFLLATAVIAAVLPKVTAQRPVDDLGRPPLRAKAEVKFQPDQAPGKPPRSQSIAARGDGTLSRFGLAFKTSTLGLGGDLGVRLLRPINLRVGFSTFHFTADLNHDGTPYEGSLRLRSLQTIVDWFPFAGSLHVSAGVIFNNHNRITATATPPPGEVQTSGNINYISDPRNPITVNALSVVRKVAPVLLLGFGNLLPPHHHFAYSFDFGVVYQGYPKSNFTLHGGACDPSGMFCVNVADDIDTRKQIADAKRDLNQSVSKFMRFYPVVSAEFGYRF